MHTKHHLTARKDGLEPTGFSISLSFGLYYAALVDARSLVVGLIKEQKTRNPLLQESLRNLEEHFSTLNHRKVEVAIDSPLIDLEKSDVLKLASKLGVPLELTWSCLTSESDLHCGECAACIERKKGFSDAGIDDPTQYTP